jgi:hypothetical protein
VKGSVDAISKAAVDIITVRDVMGVIPVKLGEGPEEYLSNTTDTPTRDGNLAPVQSWLARVKYWTGLDRAISYYVMARLWAAFAGVVTVAMITRFLTPNEQGYYYTFFSLYALQIVFELGLSFVVLQMAAHERAQLTFASNGDIGGDAVAHSRLASLLQKTVRWYSVAAVLMIAILLPAGFYFFSSNQHAGMGVSWQGPWSLLVVVAALGLQLNPIFTFIEGCGFVPLVGQMHLGQVLLGSLLSWTAMLTHHGLYSPAMMIGGQATMALAFLALPKLRRMLTSLLRRPVGSNSVGWRREIWPFQWRIAITWLSSYFISQMIAPVLFSYQGAAAAGRMGMSLSISTSIGSVGLAWMSTKSSPFGNLIARGEIAELNRLFFRTLWQSTALLATGAAGCFLCLAIGGHSFPKLAMRVLPLWAFALVLLTMIMNHVLFSEALYMRAHKREPLLVQAVVVALAVGTSTLILGRISGANAVTVGYFVIGGILSLSWGTYVFVTKRRDWYGYPKTIGRSCASECHGNDT